MPNQRNPIVGTLACALACSFRETARLLKIDRGSTLHELIREGRLRPIPWGAGRRIPLEQIQELARTGFTVGGKPAKVTSRRRRAGAACDPDALRRLDVESLRRGER